MMAPKQTQAGLADKLSATFQQNSKIRKGRQPHERGHDGANCRGAKRRRQYFFEELPTGAKNTKEIKTTVLTEMSLVAHGPRLINAFLKLKPTNYAAR
jgi:hypothetical protein